MKNNNYKEPSFNSTMVRLKESDCGSAGITANGWVFAKLPLQILQIKHKC